MLMTTSAGPVGAGGGAGAVAPIAAGSALEKDKLDQMVQQMLSQAVKPRPAGIGQASPRFSAQDLKPQGYRMGAVHTREEDIGNVLYNAGTLIHNLSAQHKQNQVRDALADWQSLDQAVQKAELAAGDPNAPDFRQKVINNLQHMTWVRAFLDPANPKSVKRLKNMYKALNQNIFDEKENVYGQALKQFHKSKMAEAQLEQLRQQVMQSRFEALAQAGQMQPPDPKTMLEASRIGVDEMKAEKEKWVFKQGTVGDTAGQWYAFDESDPSRPAKEVQIDGKPIKAPIKPLANQGKVLTIEGKPYGVISGSGVVTPSDPEFQKDAGIQRKYLEANKAWATAEAAKQKLAGARASAYMAGREYGVVDTWGDRHSLVMANAQQINKYPGRYAPASRAGAIDMSNAVFDDMDYNSNNVREAFKNLKTGLSPYHRAQLILALMSDNPGNAVQTFVSSLAKGTLTLDQIDYVTALASLEENAYALRTAGMGTASDLLRHAVARMLPGPGTPRDFVIRQIDIFDGVRNRLRKGLQAVGESPEGGGGGAGQVIKDASQIPD
jgi:hypothetical protein